MTQQAATTRHPICMADPLVALSWRLRLKCSEQELLAAIDAVGNEPDRICAYFHRSVPQKISRFFRRLMPKKV